MVLSPDLRQSMPRSGRKSTYPTVRICPATSNVTILDENTGHTQLVTGASYLGRVLN
jgi:hypothetical protein